MAGWLNRRKPYRRRNVKTHKIYWVSWLGKLLRPVIRGTKHLSLCYHEMLCASAWQRKGLWLQGHLKRSRRNIKTYKTYMVSSLSKLLRPVMLRNEASFAVLPWDASCRSVTGLWYGYLKTIQKNLQGLEAYKTKKFRPVMLRNEASFAVLPWDASGLSRTELEFTVAGTLKTFKEEYQDLQNLYGFLIKQASPACHAEERSIFCYVTMRAFGPQHDRARVYGTVDNQTLEEGKKTDKI